MKTEILECGHPESDHLPITRGYGTDENGNRHCYECCAKMDKERMIATGKATLYLTIGDQHVGHGTAHLSNWPGSLKFPVYMGHVRKGRHNIAGNRYDAWFRGPDGFMWHAVQYGDNTQIAHCKRTKGM